ncbi:DUF1700 domain-containing protein [Clostridium sp. C105KSO13]|uniref:DUF1700 domain-containing protein n=1 Tax=Clostridium sp. C105KSO13 TaxID=1776045 RepID=UPI0007407A8D|nr:hypothetical protein [Clostridium sp. C105KSO13]CUX23388.1 hypothetical protein BN3456_00664 [Clostridium sp. C105KSO13]
MTRSEFLRELRRALENDLSGSIVQENVGYYDQYITDEISKGKSEEEVLQMLGDPWVLARTVIDAQNGTDQSEVNGADRQSYTGYNNERGSTEAKHSGFHIFTADTWWKKLLWTLVIIMIVIGIVAIITGVVSFLAPILVPLLIIMIIVRILGNRYR